MKTKRRIIIIGIVLGGLLTLSPVFGLLGTVFAMIGAFNTLGNSGIGDPKALSAKMGESLLSTATGLFLLPFGIVILTVSIVLYSQLRKPTPPPLPFQGTS